jgi:excisionase family DNA binding protein
MNADNPTRATHSPECRCVTVVDAAKLLCISRGTLYALLGSGQIGSLQIGRARRIPVSELERFVRNGIER